MRITVFAIVRKRATVSEPPRLVKAVRWNAEEWAVVEHHARKMGMTASQFVRARALGTPFNEIEFGKSMPRKTA